jgi:death-on-curing protein
LPSSNVEFDSNDLINIHTLVQQSFGISAGVRDASTVAAVVARPTQMFYGNTPFPDIFSKAASMVEAIIRWQPFNDANKRTALMAASVYLWMNGHTFILALSAVRFAVEVALAQTKDYKGNEDQEKLTQLVKRIAKWLRKHSAPSASWKARAKYYLYLTIPLTLVSYAIKMRLKGLVIPTLTKWFALDIYPEYAENAEKMIEFLVRLTMASVGARR